MPLPERIKRLPDAVCVCVNNKDDGKFEGEIYNYYSRQAKSFCDLTSFINIMDKLMDDIDFPKAMVKARNFRSSDMEVGDSEPGKNKEAVLSIENLLEKKGKEKSFIIAVSSRNFATWQGYAYCIENDNSYTYESEMELINYIQEQ